MATEIGQGVICMRINDPKISVNEEKTCRLERRKKHIFVIMDKTNEANQL